MVISRRKYLKMLLKTGLVSAIGSSISTSQHSPPKHDKVDIMTNKHHEFTMVFASPYATADADYCPHMHHELKHNIETLSSGRISVQIQDSGALGIGHELMVRLVRGHVSAALVSVSNLTPAAPALDILNIPFWAASDQEYLNLVTSNVWKSLVLDKISQQGLLEVLFHYLPGPRTLSTSKEYGKVIRTPDELKNVIMRVPRSQVLKQLYNMLNASVVDVDWKDVSSLAKMGRIEAFDPSLVGLYNGPNDLNRHVGSSTQIESVQDGWLAVVSQRWLASLPPDLRAILDKASEMTFTQHLATTKIVQQTCAKKLVESGTTLYTPTREEQRDWIRRCGSQRREWLDTKKNLLGDVDTFERLIAATKVNNGYHLG